jgi:hypothetical protein
MVDDKVNIIIIEKFQTSKVPLKVFMMKGWIYKVERRNT